MKVAIMGAGLSGLACGITLEQNGIKPYIFEERSQVDDRFINGEIFLNALNKPTGDCLSYLSEKFSIYLQPVGHIKKLTIYSENERAIAKGNLGFNVVRGRSKDSIAQHMKNQLKSEIIYNSNHSYEDLLKEYTHVILATGDGSYSERLENYTTDFTVSLKGAIVEGDFDRYTVTAWLDNSFAPKGYSYLIPLSDKEANIVIAYPDYPENNSLDMNQLWDRFYKRAQQNLNQSLEIKDTFQIRKYQVGRCHEPRIGNTFFVGNCYGSIMPFLGFGQLAAITTGVYAAYDLCGKGKYEKLLKKIDKSYENSLVLRKGMEKLDNKKFDFLVKNIDGYIGNKILDTNQIDFLKIISKILKPIIDTESH